jgi:carbamate kinase
VNGFSLAGERLVCWCLPCQPVRDFRHPDWSRKAKSAGCRPARWPVSREWAGQPVREGSSHADSRRSRGNALLERGEPPDADIQERHVTRACAALAPLASEHQLIITHGNGPQVGVLALESAADPVLSRPYPFDALSAQTQGMIGYWITQALSRTVPGRSAACLLCRTLVRADDPAMSRPAKFVGPVYDASAASRLAASHGWVMRQDGAAWRRVVPSPQPVAVIELDLIKLLLSSGALVVCAGGAGCR